MENIDDFEEYTFMSVPRTTKELKNRDWWIADTGTKKAKLDQMSNLGNFEFESINTINKQIE